MDILNQKILEVLFGIKSNVTTLDEFTVSLQNQINNLLLNGLSSSTVTDYYVTGGTYSNGTLTLNRQDGVVSISGFLTGTTSGGSGTDYYVTGGTYSNGTLTLNRQDGSIIINGFLTGTTSGGSGTDYYVTGGTYSNGTLTLNRQNGSVSISGFVTGMTDTYVTGVTFNNTSRLLTISRNGGLSDLTATINDYYVTGGTYSNGSLTLNQQNGSVTINGFLTGVTDNDNYVTGGTYSNGVLTLNRQNGVVSVSGFLTGTTDTYVTGFTYNNSNLLTISRNAGQSPLTVSINNFTGLTVNGSFSATTYLGLPIDPDNYVTGGTYSNGSLTLNRQNGSVIVNGFLTGTTDTYVTGFTYNDTNKLTISRNQGQPDLNVFINTVSGLTVNGDITFNQGNLLNPDYIEFNTLYTGNTTVEGRMYWDEPNGTISLGMHGGNVLQQIGLEHYYYIKNQSGATIEDGKVVKAAGVLGASARILGEYMIADGSVPAKYTLGITAENIVNGDDGYVTEFGVVRNINTTGSLYGETWNDGDILWVSPTILGGLTKVEPSTPNLKIEMAIVLDAATNGSIFVRPNRYSSIRDLQDVKISGVTNLDIIQYDSSLGYWIHTNTPTLVSVSANTFYGTTFSGGTFYGDGSNLTGISDYYVTGGTYSNGTITLNRQNGLVSISGLLTGTTDSYVTGVTFNNSSRLLTISRNNTLSDLTVTIDDNYVTGGTYSNGTLTLNRQNGSVVVNGFLTGVTDNDNYVTGGTYSNGTLTLNRQNGNLSVSGFLTGMTDTYVTGFTYNNTNLLTISRNAGQTPLSVTISNFTGLTVNGSFSATTYLGLPVDPDNFVTGGTYSNGTITLNRQNGSVSISGLLTGTTDTYVTGFTYNNANLVTISRNAGQNPLTININNFTGLTVNGSFSATTYLGLPTDPDNYVTGGTYSNGSLTLNRQNGSVTVNGFLTGMTDTFVTGVTFNNGSRLLTISRNAGLSDLTATIDDYYVTGGTYTNGTLTLDRQNGLVTVSGFLTGTTDTYVTGFTYNNTNLLTLSQNNGQVPLNVYLNNFTGLTVNGSFSATTYLGLPVDPDNYVTGGTYTNGTLTLNRQNGSVTVNGFLTGMTDTYVTGFTYNNTNLLTINQNGGQSPLSLYLNNFSGLTVNGSLSATTYLGLPVDPDNYVTGGTYSNGTLTLNRQNGSVTVNGFLTGTTDTYVTGFTYNNTNLLTLSQNNGQIPINVYLNNFSGITVNAQNNTSTSFFNVRNSANDTDIFKVQGDGWLVNKSTSTSQTTTIYSDTLFSYFYSSGQVSIVGSGQGDLRHDAWSLRRSDATTYGVLGYTDGLRFYSGRNIIIGSQFPDGNNQLSLTNGTPPTTTGTDAFSLYSADITSGNTVPHFRTENGSIIKLYQQAPVTSVQQIADALTNLGLLSGTSVVNDSYVTGVTFNNTSRLLTISRNAGLSDLTATIEDNYVTGGTYSNGSLTLNRQNGSVLISGFLTGSSSTDTYVTGFTYNNTNLLSINQNNGQSPLSIYLNNFSGITVNAQNTSATSFFNVRNSADNRNIIEVLGDEVTNINSGQYAAYKFTKDGNQAPDFQLLAAGVKTLSLGNIYNDFGDSNYSGGLYLYNWGVLKTLLKAGGTSYFSSSKLAVGSTTAAANLEVRAPGDLSSDISFRVTNTGNTQYHFQVLGNGNIQAINNTTTNYLYHIDESFNGSNVQTFELRNGVTTGNDQVFKVVNYRWNYSDPLLTSTTLIQSNTYATSIKNTMLFNNLNANPNSSIAFNISTSPQSVTFDTLRLTSTRNVLIGGTNTNAGSAATNTMVFYNGTEPLSDLTDSFQFYAKDVVAGNSVPHIRTENGSVIKLYQQGPVTSAQEIADRLTNLGFLSGTSVVTGGGSGGTQTLAQTLVLGNTSSGTDIIMSDTDVIKSTGTTVIDLYYGGADEWYLGKSNNNIQSSGLTTTLSNDIIKHNVNLTNGSAVVYSQDEITTTGSVTNNITIATTTDGVYTVDVIVSAVNSVSGTTYGSKLFGVFKRLSGVVTEISPTNIIEMNEIGGTATTDLDVHATYITLKCTGVTGEIIKWVARYNYQYVAF